MSDYHNTSDWIIRNFATARLNKTKASLRLGEYRHRTVWRTSPTDSDTDENVLSVDKWRDRSGAGADTVHNSLHNTFIYYITPLPLFLRLLTESITPTPNVKL